MESIRRKQVIGCIHPPSAYVYGSDRYYRPGWQRITCAVCNKFVGYLPPEEYVAQEKQKKKQRAKDRAGLKSARELGSNHGDYDTWE